MSFSLLPVLLPHIVLSLPLRLHSLQIVVEEAGAALLAVTNIVLPVSHREHAHRHHCTTGVHAHARFVLVVVGAADDFGTKQLIRGRTKTASFPALAFALPAVSQRQFHRFCPHVPERAVAAAHAPRQPVPVRGRELHALGHAHVLINSSFNLLVRRLQLFPQQLFCF